ncbi:PP2C family protein-serine/threonine phosphatase [Streptomyces sp. NPDC051183]|uniref:PP2C family protein-serine/threonine phosphatase n=1 Tax=unclassified Streptomyces TaxID=2593676 RepID=UPI0034221F17
MITRGEMPQVRRVCVLAWGGAAVSWELSSPGRLVPSLASCAAFLLLALHVRHRLAAELRRVRETAGVAQQALLRPLPGRIDGLTPAASQLSLGGDLYEALPTAYGVRAVIGDVRGHGLPAVGAAAVVLGSFREAAHDEPALGGVARRMELSLDRHLRGRARAEHPSSGLGEPAAPWTEEFVTVLLVEIAADGGLTAVNCGHPWPYLIRPAGGAPRAGAEVVSLAGGETLPPLGVAPLPEKVEAQDCGFLGAGELLFLHTDGAEDARDREGRFFPLPGVLAEASAGTPARLVAGVHAALLRHTSGRLADDVALLVLRNDRS